jgi:hypothetical protein
VTTFNFKDHCKGRKKKVRPTTIKIWDDDIPRSAWSVDGVLLIVYLPKAVKEGGLVCISNQLFLILLITMLNRKC